MLEQWLGDRRGCAPAQNVELAEALRARCLIRKRRKFVSVRLANRADGGNPSLQWVGCGRPESSLDSTTAIVTTHDDVRDLEYVYGILQDRQAILIVPADDIANIAMDKKLTGRETHDFVRWDAAVGATDPEVRRSLDRAETLEKCGVTAGLLRSPSLVVGKELWKQAHKCSGRLTFELNRLRRLAKPAVAGRLERMVRPGHGTAT